MVNDRSTKPTYVLQTKQISALNEIVPLRTAASNIHTPSGMLTSLKIIRIIRRDYE